MFLPAYTATMLYDAYPY